MAEPDCAALRAWLTQSQALHPPPAELAAHVAGCANCRGALAALLAELALPGGTPAPLPCANCQEALPAFADMARARGERAAIERYPAVWWHLWTCEDCADDYRLILALAAAEAAGALAPLPLATPALPQIHLPRSFLYGALAPHAALGAHWGGGDDELLVAEEQQAGYQIAVLVQPRNDAWLVGVTVAPPLAGWVIARFHTQIFRAPLDANGVAHFTDVPADLLTGAAGPDLTITIEPDAHAA